MRAFGGPAGGLTARAVLGTAGGRVGGGDGEVDLRGEESRVGLAALLNAKLDLLVFITVDVEVLNVESKLEL